VRTIPEEMPDVTDHFLPVLRSHPVGNLVLPLRCIVSGKLGQVGFSKKTKKIAALTASVNTLAPLRRPLNVTSKAYQVETWILRTSSGAIERQ
jgi:hypothetical protein